MKLFLEADQFPEASAAIGLVNGVILGSMMWAFIFGVSYVAWVLL